MWLINDQSLAAGFIPINTQQQRASLSTKLVGGVLGRKVFTVRAATHYHSRAWQMFAVRAATYYHIRAWQMFIHGKECLILLFIPI